MQRKTTSEESKFPNEYTDVLFIQIDRHLKKLLPKYKGVPIFTKHDVDYIADIDSTNTFKCCFPHVADLVSQRFSAHDLSETRLHLTSLI